MIVWNSKNIVIVIFILIVLWSLYNWIITEYKNHISPDSFVKRNIKKF